MALNLIIATLLAATVGLITYLLTRRQARLRADALGGNLPKLRPHFQLLKPILTPANKSCATLSMKLANVRTTRKRRHLNLSEGFRDRCRTESGFRREGAIPN